MWKFVMPGIAMIGVTYAFARFSFGLFLPQISSTLNLTESLAGSISSVAFLSYTVALITSSFLIQKWGSLRVIQFAGMSAVLGLLGIAFSNGYYMLLFSSFVAGLGSGWSSPVYAQVAITHLKELDRDRGNTWMNTGTSFGLILSGPIALLFTEHWRLSYLLFAAIAFVVLVWNTKVIPKEGKSSSKRENIQWFSLLKRAKLMLLASFIVGLSSSFFWTFSRSFLAVEYQMSNFESVFFWVLMGVSGIIGGLAGGFISKGGIELSFRVTLLLMSTALLLITIPGAVTIYSSSVLFGITYICMTGILIVWSTRIFPDRPSIGVSLSFFLLGIGQSLGSSIGGTVIEATSYPLGFIVFFLIGLLGMFVPFRNQNIKEVSA
ncbi:MFS transporter [Alkalicoccobacillus porphyridii]|uniref:MFS transporter n=1 Tax=Alkalicoccobacillus porphyridii TaxID=2597270 RepID=A0A554A222_9BACI|nr:MFS transporter [Alkalicoccobacillus porphyridii]TSB47742.1 MFS transporter [Alkalicoccobacillus porphyridii]